MTSIKKLHQKEFKSILPAKNVTARKNDSLRSLRRYRCNGGVLIEVLIALLQATLKLQDEQTQQLNTTRLAHTQDNIEQRWEDMAVFGIPVITP